MFEQVVSHKVKNGAISILSVLFVVIVTVFYGNSKALQGKIAKASSGCQFLSDPVGTLAAFCDTMSTQDGTGNRSGDLDGNVWGVSRIAGGSANASQGLFDTWAPASLSFCAGNQVVLPDQDLQICGGHLREGVNDNGGQPVIAMYPKQPFDIAGRTGTVVFDVSDNSQGPHGAWPEFWYTDQPIPAPSSGTLSGVDTLPRNGFGFSLAGLQQAPSGYCPGSPWPLPRPVVTVDQMTTIANYVPHNYLSFTVDGCVIESTSPDQLNHFEVQLSATQVKVYGTDAGTTSPLKLIAHASLIMPLSRGLVWAEDVHYNANKFGNQATNTFGWANFGFDGPILTRDLTFDVPESKVPTNGGIQLGWGGTSFNWTVPGLTNINNASFAALLFNLGDVEVKPVFTYTVNGHVEVVQQWSFPDTDYFNWRTLALPIPLVDLIPGNNQVTLNIGSHAGVIANADILLAGAGGIIGSSPTPTMVPTSTSTSTSTSTVTPTSTPTPTSTFTPMVTPTSSSTPNLCLP